MVNELSEKFVCYEGYTKIGSSPSRSNKRYKKGEESIVLSRYLELCNMDYYPCAIVECDNMYSIRRLYYERYSRYGDKIVLDEKENSKVWVDKVLIKNGIIFKW